MDKGLEQLDENIIAYVKEHHGKHSTVSTMLRLWWEGRITGRPMLESSIAGVAWAESRFQGLVLFETKDCLHQASTPRLGNS